MRKAFWIVMALGLSTGGADAGPREPGPEWIQVGHDYYQRKVETKVVRYGAGNVSNYTLPLEKDEVFAWEIDDDQGFTVGCRRYGQLKVRKGEQGRAVEHTVVLGDMTYFDLNGDGVIDAMYDGKAQRPMIFFEGRHVQVQDSKAGFRFRSASAIGGGTQYRFEGNCWLSE